jgi:hypothetical protein
MRHCTVWLVVGLGALAGPAAATTPPSIYSNTQSYPLGSRAAGMAGAYTALACDEAALHYNPAALACAETSRVELAANVYMVDHFDSPSALGPGQDLGATSYHPLPSIAGFVRVLSPGTDGVGRVGVGLNVTVPRSIFLSADPPQPTKKDFFSISVRDDLLAGDVGVGWQFSRDLAFGAALGGLMRNHQTRTSLLLVSSTPSDCGGEQCFDFVASDSGVDLISIGLRAKLGARWTPIPELSVGLTFTTPTLDIFGEAKINSSTTLGIGSTGTDSELRGAIPERLRGSSALGLPARVALGVAYTFPRVQLSADLSLAFPRQVREAYALRAIAIEGLPAGPDPIEDESLQLTAQPNVNVGVEIKVSDTVHLAFGGFSDFSATSSEDLAADVSDRVHMVGFTAALGLVGRQVSSWFGVSFEGGTGSTRIRSQQLSFEQLVGGVEDTQAASFTRWALVGVIGSSYAFLDDEELPPPRP